MREFIVKFALSESRVKIRQCINYSKGPVYHVEDVSTGHLDWVGEEYILPGTIYAEESMG